MYGLGWCQRMNHQFSPGNSARNVAFFGDGEFSDFKGCKGDVPTTWLADFPHGWTGGLPLVALAKWVSFSKSKKRVEMKMRTKTSQKIEKTNTIGYRKKNKSQ